MEVNTSPLRPGAGDCARSGDSGRSDVHAVRVDARPPRRRPTPIGYLVNLLYGDLPFVPGSRMICCDMTGARRSCEPGK